MKSAPANLGFSMPPEWTPHTRTWTAWPHDDQYWCGYLESVRQEFETFVNTLATFEPVSLLVADEESHRDASKRVKGNVTLHTVPHNDVWLRDSGPTFVVKNGSVAGINWEFNGWGNKYNAELDNHVPSYIKQLIDLPLFSPGVVMEGGSLEVNGEGCLLTTKQCLLSPERNPKLSESDIELLLKDMINVSKILWLDNGLEGDHTDGHIDTITRFIDPQTIITVMCEDKSDANYETTHTNLEALKTFTDTKGKPFKVIELPLPVNRRELDGERLPPTYGNFYIANGVVIVPLYDDPNDTRAMQILAPLFPNRKVVGLSSKNLISGGGSFHCVTQQQPAGTMWEGI